MGLIERNVILTNGGVRHRLDIDASSFAGEKAERAADVSQEFQHRADARRTVADHRTVRSRYLGRRHPAQRT